MLTVARIDELNVEVYLPLAQYGEVAIGQTAIVEPAEPIGGAYSATVIVVDRVLDAASATFGVRLRLPNLDRSLPAGVRCTVGFLGGGRGRAMTSDKPDAMATNGLGALSRELYFPTFIYFRDLAKGADINRSILPAIYGWRDADRDGVHRSNVKQLGSWHSALDMMRRAEYRALTDAILATA